METNGLDQDKSYHISLLLCTTKTVNVNENKIYGNIENESIPAKYVDNGREI